MSKARLFFILSATCLLLSATAWASETIHFREWGGVGYTDVTWDDAWIKYNPATDVNYGTDGYNGIQAAPNYSVTHVYIADMFTELPATSGGADLNIISATFHMFRYNSGSSSDTLSIYRTTTNWVPDDAGSNEVDISGLYSEQSSDTSWASGGWSSSDYDSSDCSTGSFVSNYGEECETDVTTVIEAIYDAGTNYGFVISSDGSIAARASENGSSKPSLEITYEYVGGSTYTLTVNSGTGDGSYAEDAVADIDADAAPSGQDFDEWAGDTAGIASVTTADTTLTMPAANQEITATYTDKTWTLTVNSGTGDGSYVVGAIQGITADAAPSGQDFDEWTGDVTGIADVDDPTTTITMPYANAEITATYTDKTWTLTVNSGTGDGSYVVGAIQGITADAAPSGQDFDEWTGDVTGIADVDDPTTTITMPYADAEITATYTDKTWTLTVNSGTGDGSYVVGAVADIDADAPASGKQFDGWTGDITGIGDANTADTTLTMPYADAEITATYEDIPTYVLTVNSGTGDGSYAAATNVNITADTPPQGQEFDQWTGDVTGIADIHDSTTTITMPSSAAEITATYVDTGYALTVNSGTGDGQYAQGTVVGIAADAAPSGQEFTEWVGDTSGIAAVASASTTITMPASDAEITATYTDKTWTLTVNSGTGDGSYVAGAIQGITADAAASGKQFDEWIGDTSGIASVTTASTTLTMPYADAEVTATYTDLPSYTLTVNSGSGDGSYLANTVVDITADAAPSGQVFDAWTGDTGNIADAEDPTTTLTMPSANQETTATYTSTGGGTTVIVDWGDSAGNNTYDFSDWDTPYIGGYTSYSSLGPDGLKGSWTGSRVGGGVSGSTETISEDDEIVATWYNTHASSSLTITPKVSFDDEDGYAHGDSGTWYDMSQITVPAGESRESTYTVSSGAAGNYSLIHVMRVTNDAEEMLLDKIEIIVPGGTATYTLTVNNGSGDGTYEESQVVNISADAAASGQEFDAWTGDTSGIANVSSSSTTITMPGSNAEITATYAAISYYTLTVNSGSGDGSYEEDAIANISADAPASGKLFGDWVGDTSGIANVNSSSTTLTMPAANQEITATYDDIPTYALTVNSGTGDGSYQAATIVDITADAAPSGQEFEDWSGDTSGIADVNDASTTLTMPASAQEVTATYAAVGSYTLTVNSGTGDGNYEESEQANISADAAASGQFFDAWIGDTSGIADVNDPTTTLTMPAANQEITATYASVAGGLVARYTFDTDARDTCGTNDGTLTGGASVTIDGTRGSVLSLDGTDDYVDLPASAMASGRSELTITMWINPDEWVSSNTIYDEYADTEYWQFTIREDEYITRDTSTGTTGSRGNDLVMPSVGTGAWHHLAFVYSVSGGAKAIYYDGDLSTSTDVSIDTLTSSRDAARIGYPCDGDYYDGLIDDLRLYSRALNSSEIAEIAEQTEYTLTVNSGTGDGSYVQGAVANIQANAAASGYAFDEWVGDTSGIANVNSASTTLTMPASNAEITATYAAGTYYSLVVNSGTGDGSYTSATVVDIAADAPASGQQFDDWVGDTSGIADVNDSTTTLTMPASNQEITATYESAVQYTLTVNSGTGDGSYLAGAIADIDADSPASGKAFDDWVGDTSGIANVNAASTTLTMSAANAEITATYEDVGSGPSISGTSGTWSQGNTVTVSGSSFGDTGSEEPIKFDDFEGGNVGSSLATGGWSVSADNGPDVPEFSSTRSWSGSKCGYADITMGGDSAAYLTGCNSETLYVSLMHYFTIGGDPSTSKGVRVNANDGPNIYTSYPGVFIQDYHKNNRHTIKPDDEEGTGATAYTGNLSTGQWYRLEYWFKMSSPAGSTNGEVDGWQNLSHTSDWSGITRSSGVTDKYQIAMLPFYYGNGGTGENWYDDVYISKSKARVEIGNASTWSGCSTRQIQGVSSWSTSSISIKANLGSFGGASGRYLYVVDANGNVNANGYGL